MKSECNGNRCSGGSSSECFRRERDQRLAWHMSIMIRVAAPSTATYTNFLLQELHFQSASLDRQQTALGAFGNHSETNFTAAFICFLICVAKSSCSDNQSGSRRLMHLKEQSRPTAVITTGFRCVRQAEKLCLSKMLLSQQFSSL